MIKVTVYIPCHNYAHFVSKAIDSVISQTFSDWELILIDDASSDGASEIMKRYADTAPERIQFHQNIDAQGLTANANRAIRAARGQYIMRLDADDWLDENALLVMAHYLDVHPEVALCYPNYTYVDESGKLLAVEQRKRIGSETRVHDLPAHGACTMVRRRILRAVGGYDESQDRQDGYDLWLKISRRYAVADISTPLFFYRQHSSSLTKDDTKILEARARIKRKSAAKDAGSVPTRNVGLIMAKNTYADLPNIVLTNIGSKPLINWTIDCALKVGCFDILLVSTDDSRVVDYVSQSYPHVMTHLRTDAVSHKYLWDTQYMTDAVKHLESESISPDIVVSLSVHSPLREPRHIQEAIDTLVLYDVDSVISVYQDSTLHFFHGEYGLEPVNPAMHREIRTEREGLFTGNGAIKAMWRDVLMENGALNQKVSHIIMPYWQSLQIKSAQDAWLIDLLLKKQLKNESVIEID